VSSLQGYRDRVPYSVPVGPAGATGETADAASVRTDGRDD